MTRVLIIIILFVYYIYSVLPAYMPVCKKRAPDLLQMVVSHHGWFLGIELSSSGNLSLQPKGPDYCSELPLRFSRERFGY